MPRGPGPHLPAYAGVLSREAGEDKWRVVFASIMTEFIDGFSTTYEGIPDSCYRQLLLRRKDSFLRAFRSWVRAVSRRLSVKKRNKTAFIHAIGNVSCEASR